MAEIVTCPDFHSGYLVFKRILEDAYRDGMLDTTLPVWGTEEERVEFVQKTGKTEPDSYIVNLSKEEYARVKELLNAVPK